jgi:hypothetical protein
MAEGKEISEMTGTARTPMAVSQRAHQPVMAIRRQSLGNAMLSRCVVMTLGAIISSAIAAHAEDKKANGQAPQSTVNMVFGRYGYHSDPKLSATECNVHMNLDQKTFLDNFKEIQKIGLLNETLDSSTVFTEPNTLSLAFLFQMIPPATKDVYEENADADKCSFKQTMTVLDDFGNDMTVPALSYTFTRAIYRKINWDNFPNQNMIKVAPGFRIDPELQTMVSGEHNRH